MVAFRGSHNAKNWVVDDFRFYLQSFDDSCKKQIDLSDWEVVMSGVCNHNETSQRSERAIELLDCLPCEPGMRELGQL